MPVPPAVIDQSSDQPDEQRNGHAEPTERGQAVQRLPPYVHHPRVVVLHPRCRSPEGREAPNSPGHEVRGIAGNFRVGIQETAQGRDTVFEIRLIVKQRRIQGQNASQRRWITSAGVPRVRPWCAERRVARRSPPSHFWGAFAPNRMTGGPGRRPPPAFPVPIVLVSLALLFPLTDTYAENRSRLTTPPRIE